MNFRTLAEMKMFQNAAVAKTRKTFSIFYGNIKERTESPANSGTFLHLSIHFYQQSQMKYRKLFSLPYQ